MQPIGTKQRAPLRGCSTRRWVATQVAEVMYPLHMHQPVGVVEGLCNMVSIHCLQPTEPQQTSAFRAVTSW